MRLPRRMGREERKRTFASRDKRIGVGSADYSPSVSKLTESGHVVMFIERKRRAGGVSHFGTELS